MAHPSTRLLQSISIGQGTYPQGWDFVVCVLELLEEADTRDALLVNPVDDIYLRLREADICLNQDAMITFRQLLDTQRMRFPTCNPLDPTINTPTTPVPPAPVPPPL